MLIDEFRHHLDRDRQLSDRTLNAYSADIRHLYEFFGKNSAHDLAGLDVVAARQYFESLENAGYSNSTRLRRLASARIFFRYLQHREVARTNPFEQVRIERESKRETFTLSSRDIIRLLEAPDPTTWRGARDRAILATLYASGLRVGELTALDLDDFDAVGSSIHVPTPDGHRAQPLGEFAVFAIEQYLERSDSGRRQDAAPLFLNRFGDRINDRSVRKLMDRALRAAGLGHRASPHTLRHSFAQHLVDDGAKIEQVQELLRHRSRAMTKRYVDSLTAGAPSGPRDPSGSEATSTSPESPSLGRLRVR